MQNITRRIAALAIASTLTIPTTITTANAQSSFGSSSLDFGSSALGSKSSQAERTLENFLRKHGQEISREAESRAEALLRRALNGELPFDGDYYSEYSADSLSNVTRMTEAELDEQLALLEEYGETGDLPEGVQWGVAVGKKGDYYYVAIVMMFDSVPL